MHISAFASPCLAAWCLALLTATAAEVRYKPQPFPWTVSATAIETWTTTQVLHHVRSIARSEQGHYLETATAGVSGEIFYIYDLRVWFGLEISTAIFSIVDVTNPRAERVLLRRSITSGQPGDESSGRGRLAVAQGAVIELRLSLHGRQAYGNVRMEVPRRIEETGHSAERTASSRATGLVDRGPTEVNSGGLLRPTPASEWRHPWRPQLLAELGERACHRLFLRHPDHTHPESERPHPRPHRSRAHSHHAASRPGGPGWGNRPVQRSLGRHGGSRVPMASRWASSRGRDRAATDHRQCPRRRGVSCRNRASPRHDHFTDGGAAAHFPRQPRGQHHTTEPARGRFSVAGSRPPAPRAGIRSARASSCSRSDGLEQRSPGSRG